MFVALSTQDSPRICEERRLEQHTSRSRYVLAERVLCLLGNDSRIWLWSCPPLLLLNIIRLWRFQVSPWILEARRMEEVSAVRATRPNSQRDIYRPSILHAAGLSSCLPLAVERLVVTRLMRSVVSASAPFASSLATIITSATATASTAAAASSTTSSPLVAVVWLVLVLVAIVMLTRRQRMKMLLHAIHHSL